MVNTIKQINETINQLEKARKECINICNSIDIYAINLGRVMNNQERERWVKCWEANTQILRAINELNDTKKAIAKK